MTYYCFLLLVIFSCISFTKCEANAHSPRRLRSLDPSSMGMFTNADFSTDERALRSLKFGWNTLKKWGAKALNAAKPHIKSYAQKKLTNWDNVSMKELNDLIDNADFSTDERALRSLKFGWNTLKKWGAKALNAAKPHIKSYAQKKLTSWDNVQETV